MKLPIVLERSLVATQSCPFPSLSFHPFIFVHFSRTICILTYSCARVQTIRCIRVSCSSTVFFLSLSMFSHLAHIWSVMLYKMFQFLQFVVFFEFDARSFRYRSIRQRNWQKNRALPKCNDDYIVLYVCVCRRFRTRRRVF